MKKEKLIPPDLKQCQAEVMQGSFMSFGKPSYVRCTNKPTHVATEAPREDGLEQGSMSLCNDCMEVCLENLPETKCVPIK